jgi:hypothetical protein
MFNIQILRSAVYGLAISGLYQFGYLFPVSKPKVVCHISASLFSAVSIELSSDFFSNEKWLSFKGTFLCIFFADT